MRSGFLVPAGVVAFALLVGAAAMLVDRAATEALSEDARLAIELRCQDREGPAGRECRSTLERLFLAGTLDPDRTLRAYCESVKTARWGGSRPPPPRVCTDRYGGWTEG